MKTKAPAVKNQPGLATWILNSALLITIFFNSRISDPFNSPKFWILIMSAAILSGPILTKKVMLNLSNRKLYIFIKVIINIFIIFALISTLVSYEINTSIFGDNFRRNGFLTIISFVLIFLGAIKFINFQSKCYKNCIF